MSTAVLTRLRTWIDRGRQAALSCLSGRLPGKAPTLSGDTHPFDRRHRVDTAGLFYADQLVTGHPRDVHSAGYYATAPSLFHAALERWTDTLPEEGYCLEDFALLDLGCGKGRILLLASDYPFRRITGVELHPGLARVARRNLRRWTRRPAHRRARPPVEVMHADALASPLPPGPLVIFFFNSFEREIVDPFLDKLLAEAAARPDPIDLIYVHPEFGALFRRRPGIRLLADIEIPYSPEDAAADAFGTDFDRVAFYRLDPAGAPGPQAA